MTAADSMKTASKSITVAASQAACFAVAADIASYPEWVSEISGVEILEVGAQGEVLSARFSAQSFGRKTSYILGYDHSEAPAKISWKLIESDILNELSGSYSFIESSADETQIDYEVSVDLAVSIPGFVQRRAEDRIINSALDGLSKRVEAAK